jgi:hypothetical protein
VLAASLNLCTRDNLDGQGLGLLFANDGRSSDLNPFKLTELDWLADHLNRRQNRHRQVIALRPSACRGTNGQPQ